MAKKKTNFAVVRFVSPMAAIVGIVVMFALVYVWQKNQVVKIGYRITALERKITTVEDDKRQIAAKVNQLKSPDRILAKISNDLRITSGDSVIHVRRIERTPETVLAQSIDKQDDNPASWIWSVLSWLVPDRAKLSEDDMLFAQNDSGNKED